jgi:hypothetical protein
MGCNGPGDSAHRRNARPRPCTDVFRRRNSSGISERQKAVGSSSRSTGMGRSLFSARRAWRSGKKGGWVEPPAQKHGAVCANRLAKKRTPRASGVFIGTITCRRIKRESPLRQSADQKLTAVGLWQPQILELKGWGAALLSSRV